MHNIQPRPEVEQQGGQRVRGEEPPLQLRLRRPEPRRSDIYQYIGFKDIGLKDKIIFDKLTYTLYAKTLVILIGAQILGVSLEIKRLKGDEQGMSLRLRFIKTNKRKHDVINCNPL